MGDFYQSKISNPQRLASALEGGQTLLGANHRAGTQLQDGEKGTKLTQITACQIEFTART